MGKDAKVCCESCQSRWAVPGSSTSPYFRRELETKPCPACGAYTLVVSAAEQLKRRGPTVRSFVVPKRVAVAV